MFEKSVKYTILKIEIRNNLTSYGEENILLIIIYEEMKIVFRYKKSQQKNEKYNHKMKEEDYINS